uniref:Uncharacterized protein n=1 Tax=Oryza glumipatula TaxID=40148 RepID=A0A0D9YQ56_9ORYZ
MAACGCGHHAEIDSTPPPLKFCFYWSNFQGVTRRAAAAGGGGGGVCMPRCRRRSPLRSGHGPADKQREAGGAAPPPRTSDKKPAAWRPHPKPPTTMRPSGAESSAPPLPIRSHALDYCNGVCWVMMSTNLHVSVQRSTTLNISKRGTIFCSIYTIVIYLILF